jgi:hypothetical protein
MVSRRRFFTIAHNPFTLSIYFLGKRDLGIYLYRKQITTNNVRSEYYDGMV